MIPDIHTNTFGFNDNKFEGLLTNREILHSDHYGCIVKSQFNGIDTVELHPIGWKSQLLTAEQYNRKIGKLDEAIRSMM